MMKNKISAIMNLKEDDLKLLPLTENRSVASLPFACRYRLIDFPFTSLHNAAIDSAAFFISGSGRSLHDHIRSGASWGLDSSIGGGLFPHTETAIREAVEMEKVDQLNSFYHDQIHYVIRSKSQYVVMMGSKMLCNIDINALLRYHKEKEADVTVVYKNMIQSSCNGSEDERYLLFEGQTPDRVTSLVSFDKLEPSVKKAPVNMDIAIMTSEKFVELATQAGKSKLKSETMLLFKDHLDKINVVGYEYTGYLKNINSIQSYFDANMDMLKEKNYNALLTRGDSIITKVKNGAPTFYSKEAKVKNSQFASDCLVEGEVENSLIFRKVTIAEGAKISHSIVMQGSQIGKNSSLEYVILDKGVKIGEGVHLKGTADNVKVIKKNTVVEPERGVKS
ncbi:glucose-1-phosphate adenylyltransferase subunit GlgD [Carnobacterium divergens]|uniref:glucose-1-phosphate adenylyltransferase subunit GlgD n=1 Tax=Carnobacterium TaxID=2747 RepID=UPI001072B082|nr:glucose-1-phosphate adenylyltransferase subunit GlgD [Carnobacterium divergens]TFJ37006.1 glucose-1-phosphate adenylyltransferase subunit GlgD [Carnobacterium divergens]TFJ46501.1 glucose-1-phosphate adenylyltransferase subunit GlgD [Carnobacterium divergens]TFJ51207.1 glucose-1-phosphate adenylyltransferase subunit GlgD [Carnobacterium divergens]TFJ56357.1 glucose-1-phosphate adenylyltransferase subunit GlgD [Carnobacterium divergens]TFJ68274.1 glucose-1-phosphate adenylyltransferase subun